MTSDATQHAQTGSRCSCTRRSCSRRRSLTRTYQSLAMEPEGGRRHIGFNSSHLDSIYRDAVDRVRGAGTARASGCRSGRAFSRSRTSRGASTMRVTYDYRPIPRGRWPGCSAGSLLGAVGVERQSRGRGRARLRATQQEVRIRPACGWVEGVGTIPPGNFEGSTVASEGLGRSGRSTDAKRFRGLSPTPVTS